MSSSWTTIRLTPSQREPWLTVSYVSFQKCFHVCINISITCISFFKKTIRSSHYRCSFVLQHIHKHAINNINHLLLNSFEWNHKWVVMSKGMRYTICLEMALKWSFRCKLSTDPALISQSVPPSCFWKAPFPHQSSRSICEHWPPPHLLIQEPQTKGEAVWVFLWQPKHPPLKSH